MAEPETVVLKCDRSCGRFIGVLKADRGPGGIVGYRCVQCRDAQSSKPTHLNKWKANMESAIKADP